MRKLFVGMAIGALALVAAPVAQAGVLTSASLSLALGTLPAASFTAGAGAGTASGTGGTAAFNVQVGDVPTGAFQTTIPSTAAPPITKIQIIVGGNTTGNFAASAGGPMLVTGIANIKSYGGITLLGVPISAGVPATIIVPPAYGINITAIANSWTTKTTTVALLTPTSQGATQATAMGVNGLVGGSGTVVLVSALNVLTSIAGQLPAFLVLTLNYVPEPGTLLLLGSGVVGLAVLGRKKLQK